MGNLRRLADATGSCVFYSQVAKADPCLCLSCTAEGKAMKGALAHTLRHFNGLLAADPLHYIPVRCILRANTTAYEVASILWLRGILQVI